MRKLKNKKHLDLTYLEEMLTDENATLESLGKKYNLKPDTVFLNIHKQCLFLLGTHLLNTSKYIKDPYPYITNQKQNKDQWLNLLNAYKEVLKLIR